MQGTPVPSLVRQDPTCHGATIDPMLQSLCATLLDPCAQSLCRRTQPLAEKSKVWGHQLRIFGLESFAKIQGPCQSSDTTCGPAVRQRREPEELQITFEDKWKIHSRTASLVGPVTQVLHSQPRTWSGTNQGRLGVASAGGPVVKDPGLD